MIMIIGLGSFHKKMRTTQNWYVPLGQIDSLLESLVAKGLIVVVLITSTTISDDVVSIHGHLWTPPNGFNSNLDSSNLGNLGAFANG
jgi:hypothetical protein